MQIPAVWRTGLRLGNWVAQCLPILVVAIALFFSPCCAVAIQTPQDDLPAINKLKARDFLRDLESGLRNLNDTGRWDPDSQLVLQVLSRVDRIRPNLLNQLSLDTSNTTLREVIGAPEEYRGQIFHVEGVVKQVEKQTQNSDTSRPLEFFKVIIACRQAGDVIVVTRSIPDSWSDLSELVEPVSFDGFFLNLVTERNSEPRPVFVAKQIAWHPTIDSKLPGLNQGKILLAWGGVDIALFDRISKRFAKPFDHEDSYCLYQIIHATNRFKDEFAEKANHDELDIVKLFDRKLKLNGNTYEIVGNIQRVTRIEVEPEDASARHNLDHYFQIDLFIDIDYESLRLADKDGKALVFDTQFPLTIVTGELPNWIPTGSQQNIQVSVDAFFMRIWSYQSAYARRVSEGRRQQSPLMVAYRFEKIESTSSEFSLVLTVGIFAFVGVVGALVFGFWYSDKKGGPMRSRHAATLPEKIEIPPADGG